MSCSEAFAGVDAAANACFRQRLHQTDYKAVGVLQPGFLVDSEKGELVPWFLQLEVSDFSPFIFGKSAWVFVVVTGQAPCDDVERRLSQGRLLVEGDEG